MAAQEALQDQILNMPALAPPPGVVPNFINPPSYKPVMIGVTTSMLVLATLAVAMRSYTKLFLMKRLLIEDYLLISAWLTFTFGYCTISYIMINIKGSGYHQWNVHLKDMIPFLYYLFIANTIYGIVVLQIKAAIILQCLRVLVPGGIRNAAYWIFHILLWSHVIFYVICTFVEIFMCSPRRKAWDITITSGHCMNSKAVNVAASAINTASDLILVVIPQFIIWNLTMSNGRKWAVSAVFLIGLLACVAAAVRLYYSVDLLRAQDFTWGVTQMGLWVPVEQCCGFLAACIPVLPRFFNQQPALVRLGSSLRSFFRLTSSSSQKYTDELSGKDDSARPRAQGIVTDIEFEELVKRTDLSILTTEHTVSGR